MARKQQQPPYHDIRGRDVTFPDGSEGGITVQHNGYTIVVACPTPDATAAVVEAVLELQHTRRAKARAAVRKYERQRRQRGRK